MDKSKSIYAPIESYISTFPNRDHLLVNSAKSCTNKNYILKCDLIINYFFVLLSNLPKNII